MASTPGQFVVLQAIAAPRETISGKDFFALQVMVQKQNRHMSMSVYLAVLAVDDTIVLASGRKLNLLKYLITKPTLELICTRRQRLYFNFSSRIGFIEISIGGFCHQE